MNNIAELIKTNPDAFDYPDCRVAKFSNPEASESFEHLPDYLKEALREAKSAKQQADQSASQRRDAAAKGG